MGVLSVVVEVEADVGLVTGAVVAGALLTLPLVVLLVEVFVLTGCLFRVEDEAG